MLLSKMMLMNADPVWKSIAAAVLFLVAAGCGDRSTIATEDERFNIVFIVAEDLSPRIGAYGDRLARTPHIDRLAAEGILYSRVFTTSGVCAPSRAALITGMHQEAIGAQHMRTSSFGRERATAFGVFSTDGYPYETVPPPHVKAFPEFLRAAGFVTLNNVKTDYQFGAPFSIWDRSGRDVSLDDRVEGKPFFLMLSNAHTHESRLFRPETATMTDGAADRAKQYASRFGPGFAFTDPAKVAVPPYLPDTEDVRRDIARQYDNVHLLDRWVGGVIADLRERNLLDRTIVVLTTDHGDGLPRGKRTLYDSGLHVPFVIRFPDGRGAGERRDALISFVDLAPTLLSIAGIDPPKHLHGRNMLSDAPPRSYVFAARDRLDELPDRSRAVRSEDFKYIRNDVPDRAVLGPLAFRENLASMQSLRTEAARGGLNKAQAALISPDRPAEELYNVIDDPDETVNLAGDPAHDETRALMRAALDAHLERIGDLSVMDERDMVETLFWPGGDQPKTAAPVIAINDSEGGPIVTLESETVGASIGFRICVSDECDVDAVWRLYSTPFVAVHGARIEAKAVRYGFRESEIVRRRL